MGLVIISCSVKEVTHKPKSVAFYEFDFSNYSNNDFLFTPDSYTGEYESKELITVIISPEANKTRVSPNEEKTTDAIYYQGNSVNNSFWVVKDIQPDEILSEIYEKCIQIGADAFVNFKVQTESKTFVQNTPPILEYENYIISGFAIKRIK